MVAAAVVTLLALLAPAADGPAQVAQVAERTFTNEAGTRTYQLYAPAHAGPGAPLMVWLHGCGGPTPLEAGHGLAKVADEQGFVLVAPAQDRTANGMACWNWLDSARKRRDEGEPAIIAGLTRAVMTEFRSDPSRVYVGGYSAGGAMTTVMGAFHPDLYAAIAPSSGAPFGSDDYSGAKAYQAMGERARPVPAFLLQGALDEISNYAVGRFNLLQWLGTDDLADDGQANESISRRPSSVAPRVPEPGLPVPLVVEHYTAAGCEVGLFLTSPTEHAINARLLDSDIGLGIQSMMMDFLLAHRLGPPRQGCGS